jgi:hypothetical protein
MRLTVSAKQRENPHGGRCPERSLICGRGRIGEEARLYGCGRDDEIFLYQEIHGGEYDIWAYNVGVGLVKDISGARIYKPDAKQAREFYNSCPVENRFQPFPE